MFLCNLYNVLFLYNVQSFMKLYEHLSSFESKESYNPYFLAHHGWNAILIYFYCIFWRLFLILVIPMFCLLLFDQDNEISPEGLLSLLSSELKRELPEEFVYRRALSEWQQKPLGFHLPKDTRHG